MPTKAQTKLMLKAADEGQVRPYGGEWPTFYALLRSGLMAYARTPADKTDFGNIVLTDAGRKLISKAEA